jgi:hypothetical protein
MESCFVTRKTHNFGRGLRKRHISGKTDGHKITDPFHLSSMHHYIQTYHTFLHLSVEVQIHRPLKWSSDRNPCGAARPGVQNISRRTGTRPQRNPERTMKTLSILDRAWAQVARYATPHLLEVTQARPSPVGQRISCNEPTSRFSGMTIDTIQCEPTLRRESLYS